MTHNRKHIAFAQIALLAFLALSATGSLFAQQNVFYAHTTNTINTNSTSFVAIPGLSFTLPAASTTYNAAVVTVDMPNLYLSGISPNGNLGGDVGISANGAIVAQGSISSDTLSSGVTGRNPMTVVALVSLASNPRTVEAVWEGGQGDFINNDTFGSLTAILVNR